MGQSVSFAANGDVLPLPSMHVPPEYADWGIQISDWATVSSLNAHVDASNLVSVVHLTKFMLPTVGCEADAASFVEDKRLYVSKGGSEATAAAELKHNGPTGQLHLSSSCQHYIGCPGKLPESGKAVIDISVLLQPESRYDGGRAPPVVCI
jgi:hypothetical protein